MKKTGIFITILLLAVCVILFAAHRIQKFDKTLVLFRHVVVKPKTANQAHILLLGDTGEPGKEQNEVAETMEKLCRKYNVDFVIFLGDNFYPAGVESVDDPKWQTHFEKPYGLPCLGTLKFYPIFGNHDYKGNVKAQIDYTRKGGKWQFPARYYTLEIESLARFMMLDTNFPDKCFSSTLCSLDWLEDELKINRTSWTFFTGHVPLKSGGKYPNAKWNLTWLLEGLFCKNMESFYISGHDHGLQHLDFSANESCKIHQWISGGGAATLYPITPRDISQFGLNSHGVLLLTLGQEKSKFSFYIPSSDNPVYEKEYKRPTQE